jgi:hypothetical protein
MIQTGQGKFNESFYQDEEGKWTLRTSSGSSSSVSTNYKILLDEVSDSILYVGYALPGTATSAETWRIKKVLTSGAITTISYANGSDSLTNSWDLRATYTYS